MYLLGLEINLPWFITGHATLLLLTGISMVIGSGSTKTSSPRQASSSGQALTGIATMAIGLSYLLTAYMPVAENQFLHASAPARILLGITMLLKVFFGGAAVGQDERKKLLGLGIYDLLGGLLVGYWLGTFNGRVPV